VTKVYAERDLLNRRVVRGDHVIAIVRTVIHGTATALLASVEPCSQPDRDEMFCCRFDERSIAANRVEKIKQECRLIAGTPDFGESRP
jgi:hypothetical protein